MSMLEFRCSKVPRVVLHKRDGKNLAKSLKRFANNKNCRSAHHLQPLQQAAPTPSLNFNHYLSCNGFHRMLQIHSIPSSWSKSGTECCQGSKKLILVSLRRAFGARSWWNTGGAHRMDGKTLEGPDLLPNFVELLKVANCFLKQSSINHYWVNYTSQQSKSRFQVPTVAYRCLILWFCCSAEECMAITSLQWPGDNWLEALRNTLRPNDFVHPSRVPTTSARDTKVNRKGRSNGSHVPFNAMWRLFRIHGGCSSAPPWHSGAVWIYPVCKSRICNFQNGKKRSYTLRTRHEQYR